MDIPLIDQPQAILGTTLVDPWLGSALTDLRCFSGCALHMAHGEVLLLFSRIRLGEGGERPSGPPMACRRTDEATWQLLRPRWLERSRTSGLRREAVWQSSPRGGEHPIFAAGTALAEAVWNGHDLAWLSLLGPGATRARAMQVLFDPDHDGALRMEEKDAASTTSDSAALATPLGEWGWLHPAGRLSTPWGGQLLASACYEDWPLALRRELRDALAARGHHIGLHESTSRLLADPDTREPFLNRVDALMRARLQHRPDLRRRLASQPRCPDSRDDFTPWLTSAWPAWKQGFAIGSPALLDTGYQPSANTA